MRDGGGHGRYVDAWLARSARDVAPEAWCGCSRRRSMRCGAGPKITLGEVTLTAIAERVLLNASEQFPLLSALTVTPAGIELGALRGR